jgi:hypothetical protein
LEVINTYAENTSKYTGKDRNEKRKEDYKSYKIYRHRSESNLNSANIEKKKSEKNSTVKYEAFPVAAISCSVLRVCADVL